MEIDDEIKEEDSFSSLGYLEEEEKDEKSTFNDIPSSGYEAIAPVQTRNSKI